MGRHTTTLHVLYVGSSADLGALRRLMEEHGANPHRLTPAVAVVVADSSVPADHPTVCTAGTFGIPVLEPREAISQLASWRTCFEPSQPATNGTGPAAEGDRTCGYLLDNLLDKAEQALQEKLEPKVTNLRIGSTQGTGDAQLDDLLRRADGALRVTLRDHGTTKSAADLLLRAADGNPVARGEIERAAPTPRPVHAIERWWAAWHGRHDAKNPPSDPDQSRPYLESLRAHAEIGQRAVNSWLHDKIDPIVREAVQVLILLDQHRRDPAIPLEAPTKPAADDADSEPLSRIPPRVLKVREAAAAQKHTSAGYANRRRPSSGSASRAASAIT